MKKLLFKTLLFLCFAIPQLANNQTKNIFDDQQIIATIFPLNLPTSSINEQVIDTTFGSQGLKLSQSDIKMIKQAYCYLEFLTKIDLVKNNPTFAQYQNDFQEYLQPTKSTKTFLPTEKLVASKGWQAIKLTQQDLTQSAAWQNCLQAFIADSLEFDNQYILDTTQANNQIYPSLPNIETIYATKDFTQLRLYQESMQLQAHMRQIQRNNYLLQCSEWKNNTIKVLFDNVKKFTQTDFFIQTHTKPSKDKTFSIASPTKEYIQLYCMFMQLQTIIQNSLNQNNIKNFLKQNSLTNISPDFFAFTVSDFPLLSEFLTVHELYVAVQNKKGKDFVTISKTPSKGINEVTIPPATQTNTSSAQKESLPQGQPQVQNNQVVNPQDQANNTVFSQIPQLSSFNQIIDTMYGVSGLNLSPELISQIKKSYCYLEFYVKLEKVNTEKQYAQYLKTDFKNFITEHSSGTAFMPTEQLIKSDSWKSIIISTNDLLKSDAWQNFIKAMICDCFDTQATFIADHKMVNNQLTPYMPNIENAFSSNDFTQLRLYNESLQTHAMLQMQQLKIYKAQCNDWKNLEDDKLIHAINQFKKTDFYNFTHTPPTQAPKLHEKNKYTTIPSLLKEQIVCYYTLMTIQDAVYKLMTPENLMQFLTIACTQKLAPNFFFYTPKNYVGLYDYLVLTKLFNASKNNPTNDDNEMSSNLDDDDTDQKTVITQSYHQDSDQDVIIQRHRTALQRSNDRTKRAFQSMAKGMAKGTKAIGQGFVEMAAGIAFVGESFGQLFDPHINAKKDYKEIRRKMMKHVNIIGAVIFTVILAVVIVVMICATFGAAAPLAAGMAVADATATAAATAATATTAAAVATADAVATTAAAIGTTMTALATGELTVSAAATAALVAVAPTATITGTIYATTIVAGTAIGIAAATDPGFRNDLNAQVFAPMMKGMAIMTQGLTNGFIGMSVGLTWFGCGIAQGLGYPVNADEQAHLVREKMDKYQSTLNICMSVFLTVVITIAVMAMTAGAGAMYGYAASYLEATAVSAEAAASTAEIAADAASMLAIGIADEETAAVVVEANQLNAAATTLRNSATAARNLANFVPTATAPAGTAIEAGQTIEQTGAKQGAQQTTTLASKQAAQSTIEENALEWQNIANQAVSTAQKAELELQQAEITLETTQASLKEAQATLQAAQENLAKDETSVLAQENFKSAQKQVTILEEKVELASKNAAAKETAAQAAKEASEHAAVKFATQKEAFNTTTKEIAEESARLASRSSFQIGQEEGLIQGMWTAMKQGTFNFSFFIGQAINAGFGVFSAMAAYNQDEIAIDQAKQEEKSIKTFWRFVEDSKINSVQTQQLFTRELHKKHQAAVVNQALGLQYYQNFLNSSINNLENQIAQALAQQQIQLLTPDENGQIAADIGSNWGLKTQFVYLYPSQGFITTTLARPDFPYAQEVAQAPLAAQSTSNDTSKKTTDSNAFAIKDGHPSNQSSQDKLWFNQRAIVALDQTTNDPLTVEIKFRVIYNLTTAYHVGLYLGGTYYNYNSPDYLQKIQNENKIDINAAHLAKMFVLKRENQNATPQLGVYENEGKEWIVQEDVDKNSIHSNTVYHMKATLDNSQLTISFWTEESPDQIWTKNITVTACDQRTFGIIFSGIAIEWNVITPQLTIQENAQTRSTSDGQAESDREQASKAVWQQILYPQFANLQLQFLNMSAIVQGRYMYTTQSTGLVDQQANPITDYVVFGTNNNNVITNMGTNPTGSTQPNAVISLISGNVYDTTGAIVGQQQNAFDVYAQTNKTIPKKVGDLIVQTKTNYQQPSTPTQQPIITLQAQTNTAPQVTAGSQIGLTSAAPSQITPTKASISQLQQSAAGSATIELTSLSTSTDTGGLNIANSSGFAF
ncbi:MAG: hypothetical protein ACXWL5_04435 [Candidatus Chromulinivorax sp.]